MLFTARQIPDSHVPSPADYRAVRDTPIRARNADLLEAPGANDGDITGDDSTDRTDLT